MAPPPAAPPPAAPPPQGAAAKTMFVAAGPASSAPPPPQQPPPPAASGASTMFQPSPFAGGANPNAPMGGPPPGMGGPMGGPPPGMGGPMGGPPPGMGGPMGGMPPGMGGPMGGPPPGLGGMPPGMGGMPPGLGGSPPGMGGPMSGPLGGPPPGMGGMPPGMGGPPPGMGGYQQPGMQPGMGGPPPGMGGYQQPGMQPGMGGPPPGMGGYQQPGMQQPMGGMPQPGMPYGSPPYLASRAGRAGAPFEPFNDGLRACLIVFGVLLLAAFAVPMTIEPAMTFRWDVLKSDQLDALAKFDHIYLAAAGVLALVFGLVPLATVPRGALAAVLGLVPLTLTLVNHLKGPKVEWQFILGFIAALTLVAGLLLRHEYRSAMLGRLLATVGALCVLVPLLVPVGGGDPPIKAFLTQLTDGDGEAKVRAIVQLLPFILAMASFLVWMPAPSSAGAKVIAWLFILTGVIVSYSGLLIRGHLADVLKVSLNASLLTGWVFAAWAALLGYGLATVFGKNLEQQG